jgi:putative phosphoribosyl transferase
MLMQPIHPAAVYGVPIIGYDDRYEDRAAAGRRLAEQLHQYRGTRAIVLALPPGGVAVAGELAQALRLPLDVVVARAFAVRAYPSLVAGALSEAGGLCFDAAVLRLPGVSPCDGWREAVRTQREVAALTAAYRHGRPLPVLTRRPVILVDDGLGGGLLQLAALQALRRLHPQRCIVATPYGASVAARLVARRADTLVALATEPGEPREAAWQWHQALGDDDAAVLFERCRAHAPPG